MGCESVFSFFFLFLLLSSSATDCDRCMGQSKAAYFSSSSSISVGACGYGSMALGLNGGFIAAGSPDLHKRGVGCGECFQIRCKNTSLCSSGGVKVILTDSNNKNNNTGFILSSNAFEAMARKGMAQELKKHSILDVEHKRIPCEYRNHNLSVRVEEGSRMPNRLAIKFLYQGGQTDIVAVDVAQVGSAGWRFMNHDFGPIWSTNRAPTGPLQFRMVVTSGYDGKWVWAPTAVLPTEWKVGSVYDMGVQITDIARDAATIGIGEWK